MQYDEPQTTVPGHCANCGAQLPPDQPADNRYCATCSAAWRQGAAEDPPMTVPGDCANCGAQLPPDQPADNRYCATCSAAWRRGTAERSSPLSSRTTPPPA
jgi:DNA-directed RNA polymerase subunit RPC12/RpoP